MAQGLSSKDARGRDLLGTCLPHQTHSHLLTTTSKENVCSGPGSAVEAQDSSLLPPQGCSDSQAEVTGELGAHWASGHVYHVLWVTWAICICFVKDILLFLVGLDLVSESSRNDLGVGKDTWKPVVSHFWAGHLGHTWPKG